MPGVLVSQPTERDRASSGVLWFQALQRLFSEGSLRSAQGRASCFVKGSSFLTHKLAGGLRSLCPTLEGNFVTLESRSSREGPVEIGGTALKHMDFPYTQTRGLSPE